MKTTKIALALCGAILAFSAHAEITKNDQEFLQKAAVDGLYEVEAGGLAQSKGQSEAVKSFGAMLFKDHSAVNEEIQTLAASKGVTLPVTVPTPKKKRLEMISADQNFDNEFLKKMGLDDHMEGIRLFENASKHADDADVKAFATRTLPTLKVHKEHAEELRRSRSR